MNLSERFGRNLARHRQSADLTQEGLGEKAGLHHNTIGELERGERVGRLDTLAKLCGALEIDANALMQGIGWVSSDGSTAGHFENRRVFEDDLAELEAESALAR